LSRPTDHELDLSVAAMLRLGVTLAALVVLAGGLLYLRHPFGPTPNYIHFNPGGPSTRTVPGIVRSALHLDPRGIIQLGLLLLIATPVARVGFCVVGFARQRSRLYVAISSIVLAILLYSLARGMH
jgi:uncharacterized membrane protein